MSFGYSAGDFVLLVQLAHKTFRNCQRAGEEYIEIACEVRCLHSVLRTLRSEAQTPDSKIFTQDPASTSQLIATADGCKNVLENLDNVLVRYEGLKIDGQASASKKLWQKFRFGSKVDELGVIRGKLVTYTSIISIIIDTMQVQAADRMERNFDGSFTSITAHMSGQFERMRKVIHTIAAAKRAEERRGAMISTLSLSTYTGDEKAVWQDFRKELLGKGFRSTSLERHKHVLQAYVMRLDQSGLLDQDEMSVSKGDKSSQRWSRKKYMETINSIAEIKIDEDLVEPEMRVSIVNTVHQDAKGGDAKSDPPKEPVFETKSPTKSNSGDVTLTWDQESTASSEQDTPSEEEATDSASSSEAEPDDTPANDKTKVQNPEITSITLPSGLNFQTAEPNDQDVEDLVSSKSIVFDWLDRGKSETSKKRPQAYVRDEEEEDELTGASPQAETPPSTDEETPTPAEEDCILETSIPLVTPAQTVSSPPETVRPSLMRRRSEGNRQSRDAQISFAEPAQRSQVGQWNRWNYTGAQTMSIDGAISIEGTSTSTRTRHREGERRHISSRPPSASSNWDEVNRATQSRSRRYSTYISPSRPRSMPTSPIRSPAPTIHQPQSRDSSRSYRIHTRSTPTSPIRPQPPSLHQSRKSKVHYRTSTTLIVDPPAPISPPLPHTSAHTSPLPSPPRPLKGILKTPTDRFPEDPSPSREGVAAHKDAVLNGIPPSARWTKISRKLVNPEALEAGKERYEVREEEGVVIVLRVVSREEIEGYMEVTQKIRALREAKSVKERKRSSVSSPAAVVATPTDYNPGALSFLIT